MSVVSSGIIQKRGSLLQRLLHLSWVRVGAGSVEVEDAQPAWPPALGEDGERTTVGQSGTTSESLSL